ncbi:MAG: carboxypeptidase M32 [Solirubrobacteraceae bacterium]
MTDAVRALRARMADIEDLGFATGVLSWDQQTMMPPRGAEARADALATLTRISHEMFVSAETGRMLDAAASQLTGSEPDGDDGRLVAVVRRRWEKRRRVSSELAADMARAGSLGQEAWTVARRESDFAAFAPYLQRNLELAQRYVDCFDGYECAYDVLLDDYEPQMRTTEVQRLFTELRSELVPLIAKVAALPLDDSCLHGHFPVESQRALVAGVLALMGFDPTGWRLDDSAHPFMTSFGAGDVRITTRWDETFFASALFGAMHECGHGLYEAGIAPSLQRTPIGRPDSLGLHESQSRLWENIVGRGRSFCEVIAPRIARQFGGTLADLDGETLFRAVNRVQPSLIRVEADEATYALHIVLRFELEQELIDGRLTVADLPAAWNARFKQYLDIDVPSYADGVLQDVHWSAGMVGYFPTYALGNLIAGQLWARVREDIPDLETQVAAGELSALRAWLGDRVHRHGSKFPTTELLERVVGGPIQVQPFMSYLKLKLSGVYGTSL